MSHPWANLAHLAAISVCIGLGVYFYPEVNDRVWNMLQTQQQVVRQGSQPHRGTELTEVMRSVETIHAEAPFRQQVTLARPGELVLHEKTAQTAQRAAFETLAIAPAVTGTSASIVEQVSQPGQGSQPPGLSPHFQSVLFSPPEMAIGAKVGQHALSENGWEISSGKPGGATHENRSTEMDERLFSGDPGPAEASQRSSSVVSDRVSRSFSPDGSEAESALPPLVPITQAGRKKEPVSNRQQGLQSGRVYQDLPVQGVVAHRVEQIPSQLTGDLPLVSVIRNRWFSEEKPERLPPVESENSSGNRTLLPTDLPAIPLYPSTGRSFFLPD